MQPSASVPTFTSPFSFLPTTIDPATLLSVLFTLVFIWWAIFTIVLVYHWWRFGRDSWMAVPIVALHFVVSGWLFVYATGALQ